MFPLARKLGVVKLWFQSGHRVIPTVQARYIGVALQSMNQYAYTQNNPIDFLDTTGTDLLIARVARTFGMGLSRVSGLFETKNLTKCST